MAEITLENALKNSEFKTLFEDAVKSVLWREHPITDDLWTVEQDSNKITAFAECPSCVKTVSIDTKPAPNGIVIGGAAVALTCESSTRNSPMNFQLTLKKALKNERFKIFFNTAKEIAHIRDHPIHDDLWTISAVGEERYTAEARCPICGNVVWIDTVPGHDLSEFIYGSGITVRCDPYKNLFTSPDVYVATHFMEFSLKELARWFSRHSVQTIDLTFRTLPTLFDLLPLEWWMRYNMKNAPEINEQYRIEQGYDTLGLSKAQATRLGLREYTHILKFTDQDGNREYDYITADGWADFMEDFEYCIY